MKKPTSHKVYPKTRSSSLLHDIFSHLFKNWHEDRAFSNKKMTRKINLQQLTQAKNICEKSNKL